MLPPFSQFAARSTPMRTLLFGINGRGNVAMRWTKI